MSGYSGSAAACVNISMLCRLKLLAASISEPRINAVVRAVAMRQCAFKSVRWRANRITFCKCQRSKVTGSQHVHVRCCVDPQRPFTLWCISVYGFDGAYNHVDLLMVLKSSFIILEILPVLSVVMSVTINSILARCQQWKYTLRIYNVFNV